MADVNKYYPNRIHMASSNDSSWVLRIITYCALTTSITTEVQCVIKLRIKPNDFQTSLSITHLHFRNAFIFLNSRIE